MFRSLLLEREFSKHAKVHQPTSKKSGIPLTIGIYIALTRDPESTSKLCLPCLYQYYLDRKLTEDEVTTLALQRLDVIKGTWSH